jgi:hypothetical protein
MQLSFQILRRFVDWQGLRRAQPEGVTRRIFLYPFSSFDTTTLSPRTSGSARRRASTAQMVSKTVLSPTLPEMSRRYKRKLGKISGGGAEAPLNCHGAQKWGTLAA